MSWLSSLLLMSILLLWLYFYTVCCDMVCPAENRRALFIYCYVLLVVSAPFISFDDELYDWMP